MTYLAGPYSHPSSDVVHQRYLHHLEHLALLLQDGLIVFSPIVHWHNAATKHNLPRDWEFWRRLDLHILYRCDRLIVLRLDGWKESVGVTAEIEFATINNIPIDYHDPKHL